MLVAAKRHAFLLAIPIAIVSGCRPPDATRPDPVRPVKTQVVTAGDGLHTRIFSGRAEAANKAELAFQVSGPLVSLPVKEGQAVKKGEVIGQIRKSDFESRLNALKADLDRARAALRAAQTGARPEAQRQLEAQLRAARAALEKARAEFERSRQLVGTGAISRTQFDADEAAYRVAQEQYKGAQEAVEKGTTAREEDLDAKEAAVRGLEARVVEADQALDDATLTAPFDGVIAQVLVNQNESVQARQPVVKFQDVDEVEVAVDVPETVMAGDLRSADIVSLVAEFAAAPGVQFPIRIKEIAQRADPVTQTFRIRAALQAQPNINLLPGMTATVTVQFRRADILGNRILVPVSAVMQDANGQQIVWVIGADLKAARRNVKLGEASGGTVEVTEGLQPGDRIAVAGVTHLRDGMAVRDLGDALGGAQP
jgi:RND family efflux transporter MFP subunit